MGIGSFVKGIAGIAGAATGNPWLAAAGQVIGGLGDSKGTKKAVPTTGIGVMPQQVQNLLLGDVFDQIKEIQDRPYKGVPLRRVNMDDLDPVFGSRARADIQNYADRNGGLYDKRSSPIEAGKQIVANRDFSGIAGINPNYTYSDADFNRLTDAFQNGFKPVRYDDFLKALGGASMGRATGSNQLVNLFNELVKKYPTQGAGA